MQNFSSSEIIIILALVILAISIISCNIIMKKQEKEMDDEIKRIINKRKYTK